MYKIAIFAVAAVLLLPLASSSFASNIQISIAMGSASPVSKLWFSPTGSSALVGDIITFSNGDSVPHEIVSGTPDSGPDGKFDSGTINPGMSSSYKLTSNDVGTLSFYDKSYQWMITSVVVSPAPTGYKVKAGVGADAGDGKTTFDIQYQSVKDIVGASIGSKDHSLNLVLAGQTTQNSNLVLRLPTGLINGPFLGVQINGQFTKNFTTTQEEDVNVFTIPITPVTEQVSIVGSSVVPEFGPVAGLVLIISIIGIVLFARIRPIHRLG